MRVTHVLVAALSFLPGAAESLEGHRVRNETELPLVLRPVPEKSSGCTLRVKVYRAGEPLPVRVEHTLVDFASARPKAIHLWTQDGMSFMTAVHAAELDAANRASSFRLPGTTFDPIAEVPPAPPVVVSRSVFQITAVRPDGDQALGWLHFEEALADPRGEAVTSLRLEPAPGPGPELRTVPMDSGLILRLPETGGDEPALEAPRAGSPLPEPSNPKSPSPRALPDEQPACCVVM